MGRVVLAAVAAALLLGATACGERSEPTGATAPLYPVTVQSANDRPVVAAQPARRIAVLDQPSEEILNGLGVGSRIVFHAPGNTIDFVALRHAHPDLVVASDATDPRTLSHAAAATRAPVYTAPGESIHQVEQAITQLGLLTGTPVAGRRLVERIEAQRRRVDLKLAHARPVSVFVDTGFFTTVSDQSLIGDVIREAHGTNVGGQSAAGGPIDAPELHQLDPDVYMTTSDTDLSLQDLKRNRETRTLRAVQDGRFAVANIDLLQPGPRIGEGLVEIAKILHPDAFR